MTYRILVTGTRNQLTGHQKQAVVDRLYMTQHGFHCEGGPESEVVFVHGSCPSGVDAYVDFIVPVHYGTGIERHPADWYTHDQNCYHAPQSGGKCPAAGPRRNKLMVDLGADICLAFPMGKSAGTRGCVKLAEAAGIPTIVTEL